LAQAVTLNERLEITPRSGASSTLAPFTTANLPLAHPPAPWLVKAVTALPLGMFGTDIATAQVPEARTSIQTVLGVVDLRLVGDLRVIDEPVANAAARMGGYVGAMLGALLLAWVIVEWRVIRRIAVLTRRAAAVPRDLPGAPAGNTESHLAALRFTDLRGPDELGILAGGLDDLLKRVQDDLARERIRAGQERDMWHAVGHEIMSPLQSLMVLHGKPQDPSHRYVHRMQQAVRVLYGTASPSEAIASADIDVAVLDLDGFLAQVADNAAFAGVADVQYAPAGKAVQVRADAFSLEDVITHVLNNAARFRTPGTPIVLSLVKEGSVATVSIANEGTTIPDTLMPKIFEYGTSGEAVPSAGDHRGQGLFVVKTYMAKMGGSVWAENMANGVVFKLQLALA
jgi:two-component system, OmpR family, sensor kinase